MSLTTERQTAFAMTATLLINVVAVMALVAEEPELSTDYQRLVKEEIYNLALATAGW